MDKKLTNLLLLFLCCLIDQVLCYPYKLSCDRPMLPGSYIMFYTAVRDTTSLQKTVVVKRGTATLADGDQYVPGEQLTVSISSLSTLTTKVRFQFEATNGATFTNCNYGSLVGCLCNNKRLWNNWDSTVGGYELTMPASGIVNIWVAYSYAKSTLYVSGNFTMYDFAQTRVPSAAPTPIVTKVPSSSPTYKPTNDFKTQNVTLGGMFSIFKEENGTTVTDKEQIENLHAFLLAVNETNNQFDVLPNHLIDVVIRTPNAGDFKGVVEAAVDFVNNKVAAVIGSLDDDGTEASNKVLNDYKIVQAHSMAMSANLGLGTDFPYKIQIVPSRTLDGIALQSLLCQSWNVTTIQIIASSDVYGQKLSTRMHDNTICPLETPIDVHFVGSSVYEEDFSFYQKTLLGQTDIVIYALFLPPKGTAMFLEQAFELGLLDDGIQFFTDSRAIGSELFEWFSSNAPVEEILKGVVAVEFFDDYFFSTTTGQQYVTNFKNQASSVNNCASITDISGVNYLESTDNAVCAGLDLNVYYQNGSNLSPYSGYTYDATYAVIQGLHEQLYNNHDDENLDSVIKKYVSFEGATGFVDFEVGDETQDRDLFGEGDREKGYTYKVLNFYEPAFLNDSSTSFVQVGTWSKDSLFQSCETWMNCIAALTFRNVNNELPDSYPPYAFATLPKILKVGGLFTPFDESGNVLIDQVENLHAFLMAIDQINDKTDGIWDDILPNTQIKFMIYGSAWDYSGGATGMKSLMNGFYESGVNAVVGALGDDATISADLVGNNYKTVQIHSVAQSAELGDGSTYRYKAQLTPIENSQGLALQSLLCSDQFYAQKVSVFATYDYFGTNAISELTDGTYCDISVISTVFIFIPDAEDFSDALAEAKEGGALYYVFFVAPYTTAQLIEQGYDQGIYKTGTQFLGVKDNTNSETLKHFIKTDQIATYMRGFIGVEYFPDYAFYLESGKQFMTEWINQPATTATMVRDRLRCRDDKDDEGKYFLFRDTDETVCIGLDYSLYNADGSTFTSKYVLHTYDATVAMAQGFDLLIKNGISITSDNLLDQILTNVAFNGSSGFVRFFEGSASTGDYGRGVRKGGNYYRILNFQSDAYAVNSNESMVPIGIWNANEGIMSCSELVTCGSVKYNSESNQKTDDTPEDIIITMVPAAVQGLKALGVISGIIVTFFIVITFIYRKSKLMKASQLPLLWLILLGEIFGVARIINAAMPITDASCIGGLWASHLAFFMVFGCLVVKTWRVDRLLNNKSLKKIKISNSFVFKLIAVIQGSVVFYLVLLTFVGQPHLAYTSSTSSNQTTKYPYCGYVYPEFNLLLMIVELLVLFYGTKLCWNVKDVPDAISESQYIAGAMALIAIISFMMFPFLLGQPHSVQQIATTIAFGVAVIATVSIIFSPKAKILLTGNDLQKDMSIGPVNGHRKVTPNGSSGERPRSSSNENLLSKGTEIVVDKNDSDAAIIVDEKSNNYYPGLHQIKGNYREKLEKINGVMKHWSQIKTQVEQQILNSNEQSNSSVYVASDNVSENEA